MKSSPSEISIIIVSWNVAGSLKRCLDSIFSTKYPKLQVVVIDNHSADDSVAIANSFKKQDVVVVTNFGNLGFPKAVNQGLSRSTGEYILLLNPDTRLPKDYFTKAIEFMNNHPDAAVMGPALVDPDGKPQGSVFPEPSISLAIKEFWLGKKGLTAKYTPKVDKPISVNAVSGACMFFPHKTLDRIGNFTEEVFMYYEDLDYCRRIRKSGWKIYFNPEIKVLHEHGQSSVQTGNMAGKYLRDSSLWYNGTVKHHLLWFITRTGQLLFSSSNKSNSNLKN